MNEVTDSTPHWLRHTNPTVAGLLLAGWLMEQEGPAVADCIARAALPNAPDEPLQDLVQDVSYMLRQAQALEDDPLVALHAQGIEVEWPNQPTQVAGECCDSLREDARRMAELAVRPHAVADPAPSSEFTRGLRALADFLDEHPDVPQPQHGHTIHMPLGDYDTDNDGIAAVAEVAAAMDASVNLTGQHKVASRHFGPVTYDVYYSPKDVMDRHNALQSYAGSVSA